jgi:phosphatidylserine/phosphatidylglycerophosphate/cardiolipin synthase-like enzyme
MASRRLRLRAMSDGTLGIPGVYTKVALDPDGPGGILHAKAVVTDDEAVFVTSANLTEAALDRNIELGVLIRDRALAHIVAAPGNFCGGRCRRPAARARCAMQGQAGPRLRYRHTLRWNFLLGMVEPAPGAAPDDALRM